MSATGLVSGVSGDTAKKSYEFIVVIRMQMTLLVNKLYEK